MLAVAPAQGIVRLPAPTPPGDESQNKEKFIERAGKKLRSPKKIYTCESKEQKVESQKEISDEILARGRGERAWARGGKSPNSGRDLTRTWESLADLSLPPLLSPYRFLIFFSPLLRSLIGNIGPLPLRCGGWDPLRCLKIGPERPGRRNLVRSGKAIGPENDLRTHMNAYV